MTGISPHHPAPLRAGFSIGNEGCSLQLRWWWDRWKTELDRRWFLQVLFLINLVGSIYGFYWYKNQLIATGNWLNLFVPDSPTASLAFSWVLLLYLCRRRSPFWEAFAGVTLFKYGIWAVAMILVGAALAEGPFLQALTWTDWMLMGSHLGMALEGVLYSRFFTFGRKELILVGVWTLLNDGVDYGLDLHPWLPLSMIGLDSAVAIFTIGLSLISLTLFAILTWPEKEDRKWEYTLWLNFH